MLNTQQYGEALWRAAINDGLDPNESTQSYSYDWHRDANGRPVLQSVTPRESLNPDCSMRSADTAWLDELAQTGRQSPQQITLTTGTDRFRSLFSANHP